MVTLFGIVVCMDMVVPLTNNALVKLEGKRTAHQRRIIKETVNALLVTNTQVDAAKLLKISESTLRQRMKRFPEIRKAVEDEIKINVPRARKLMLKHAVEAASVIVDLMRNSKDDMRLKAAIEILDRSGVTKEGKANVQVNVLNAINNDKKKFDL